MIVAHHAGEDLVLLLAGSGGAGPLLLVVWRARLGRMVDRMKKR